MPEYVRGHIWLVNFDPQVGSEIQKQRPAVIVSSDAAQRLAIKLVVPLTKWQESFGSSFWHVRVVPDDQNGLNQIDAADVLQMRCVSYRRFGSWVGRMSADHMEQISAAIAAIVEYV